MQKPSGLSIVIRRWLPYAWLVVLAATLSFFAVSTDRRVRQVEEFPCCCDPFGYLQMAKDIRQGSSEGVGPKFTIESDHTRRLIQLMQSRKVPVPLWEHVVAPLAYHYFPRVDRVGVQYPPGVGLAFALFPQDKALHGFGHSTVAIFLVSGIVLLVVAMFRRLWLSAGLVVLSLVFGLDILGRIDNASFSINVMLAPLLLCGLCLFWAFAVASRSSISAWCLTFFAGLLFGFAVLVRLPILLLMPGILVLLWNNKWRSWHRSAMPAFMVGAILGGALPLLIYQHRMTGAWYSSTYPSFDNTPPTLEFLAKNLSHYFGAGKARPFFWALPIAVIGWLGLYLWMKTRESSPRRDSNLFLPRLTWTKLIVAALLVWGISMAYNLTHSIAGNYYQVPATFGTVLLLGLGAFALEHRTAQENGNSTLLKSLQYIGLALALVPGIATIHQAWTKYHRPVDTRVTSRFSLPEELADDRAWIWADHLSGTIWYYTARPAHKLAHTNRETREVIYEFMRSHSEPHYLIADAPNAQPLLEEIVKLGGKTELRGKVNGYPYHLIEWPAASPDRKVVLRTNTDEAGRLVVSY